MLLYSPLLYSFVKMRFVTLVFLVLLSCAVVGQQENLVNPATILNECTKSRVVCEQSAKTCVDVGAATESSFSWTGLKVVLAVVVGILACFFGFRTFGAFIRFLDDLRKSRERNRYVEQLEATNKSLMGVSQQLSERVVLLERENVLLAEFRLKAAESKPVSEVKRMSWVRYFIILGCWAVALILVAIVYLKGWF